MTLDLRQRRNPAKDDTFVIRWYKPQPAPRLQRGANGQLFITINLHYKF